MIDSNFVKIFSGNFIYVNRIVAALQEIGISPVIKDESESARLAGFGTFVQGEQEVYVNKDELDKATEVIDSLKEQL